MVVNMMFSLLKTKKLSFKKAFSLVELLISLIIISLIATLFVPVLTKKIKHDNLVLAAKTASLDCNKFDSKGRCLMCDKTKGCTLCTTQMTPVESKFVYPLDGCDYKDCTEGCLKCTHEGCNECKDGYYLDSVEKICKKCSTKYGAFCKTCNEQGCDGCINSNYALTSDKQSCIESWLYPNNENCARVNAYYQVVNGKKLCVTKYNMGDNGLPLIGVNVVNAFNYCSGACCWRGQTADLNKCDAGGICANYNCCYRTVCNYSAAAVACRNYHFGGNIKEDNWRVTNASESAFWTHKGSTSTSIAHCLPEGFPRCYGTSACKGATSDWCSPDQISPPDSSYNTGRSVRCVLEKYKME